MDMKWVCEEEDGDRDTVNAIKSLMEGGINISKTTDPINLYNLLQFLVRPF